MNKQNTISCEEALRLLASYLDQELVSAESEVVHEHLERCRSCYSRAEFERRLKQQLAELGKREVPADLEQRIRMIIS